MKLLIVDDSSVVRRAIERDLESGEITEVDQAATGEDAVRLYSAKLHHVVTKDFAAAKDMVWSAGAIVPREHR